MMPIFTYSGSDTSEHGKSPNETENVNTSEEPRQESNIGTIAYGKDQTIEGYPIPDELHYRSDGYISKTYDPDMYTNTCMPRGAVIITVNEAVWEGLQHHEHILWGRLGCIEKVKGTSPRLIERVLLKANKNDQDNYTGKGYERAIRCGGAARGIQRTSHRY